jgi:hypothetical protein
MLAPFATNSKKPLTPYTKAPAVFEFRNFKVVPAVRYL